MKRHFMVAVLAAALSGAAWAQTASELLQKGVYTQETLGDFDGAIKIYRQLLEAESQNRVYAAQAQYRLGVCLAAKGDAAGAAKAFQAVIDKYPEQTELAEKARERTNTGLQLLPAPWADGETLEMAMKTTQGLTAGLMVYSVEPAPGDPGRRLVLRTGMYSMMYQTQNQVTVERDSLRPVASEYSMPMSGQQFRTEYTARSATVQTNGKTTTTVELTAPVYEDQQIAFLLRRLPLAPGFKTVIPILSTAGAALGKAPVEVVGVEDVEVAAGKFRCYKVQVTQANVYYWIATENPRYIVKLEMVGMLSVELKSVRTPGSTAAVNFRDPESGLALTAPGDWSILKMEMPTGKAPRKSWMALIFDPQMAGPTMIEVERREPRPGDLKAEAEQYAEQQSGVRKQYAVRAESWQARQIGGQQAISYVADCTPLMGPPAKVVDYVTIVRSPAATARLSSQVDAERIDSFRKRFDPILESVQLDNVR